MFSGAALLGGAACQGSKSVQKDLEPQRPAPKPTLSVASCDESFPSIQKLDGSEALTEDERVKAIAVWLNLQAALDLASEARFKSDRPTMTDLRQSLSACTFQNALVAKPFEREVVAYSLSTTSQCPMRITQVATAAPNAPELSFDLDMHFSSFFNDVAQENIALKDFILRQGSRSRNTGAPIVAGETRTRDVLSFMATLNFSVVEPISGISADATGDFLKAEASVDHRTCVSVDGTSLGIARDQLKVFLPEGKVAILQHTLITQPDGSLATTMTLNGDALPTSATGAYVESAVAHGWFVDPKGVTSASASEGMLTPISATLIRPAPRGPDFASSRLSTVAVSGN